MVFKSIGKNVPRVEAVAKVTGAAKFTADLKFPRELFARVIRSSQAHAVIKKIDYAQALTIPGVRGVITGENSTETISACIKDQPPLAREKVRFVGEPVAVVVAQSKEIALQASQEVKIDYDPLPAVLSSQQAMAENAPLIHEKEAKVVPGFYPQQNTNIFHHFKIRKGDTEKALKESAFTISGKMHWPHLAHCPMESHVTIARWSHDNRLQVYTSAQSPFDVRHFLGETFALPLKNIQVTTNLVGGAFGCKSDVTIEPLTVFVAKHFPGEYVRIQLDREEVFVGTVVGRGLDSEYTVAFNEQGIIEGLKVKYILDSGGYAGYAINIVQPGAIACSGTYYIPNLHVDAYGVYTNKPPVGAYRAYGHPEAALISEKVIEKIARKLGISAMEVRRKNIIRSGQENSIGQIFSDNEGNLQACMDIVEKDINGYTKETNLEHYARGKALANLIKAPGMPTNGFSSAIIKLNEDMTATVLISGIDMGQGLLTTISQIAAEALMMPFENIEVTPLIDTRYTPYEWQTVASRSTWMVGNAVYKAAEDVISKIKGNAAIALAQPVSDLVYDGHNVYYRFDRRRTIAVKELMMGYSFANGRTAGCPPVGYGAYVPEVEYSREEDGQGDAAAQWTCGSQGVVLDVDIHTGEIHTRLVSSAIDIGKIINPAGALGQVEGAVAMGIGGAIMEEVIYSDRGNVRNQEFTDYKIPTAEDMVDIELKTHFVETPDRTMIYGAKCLGEHPIIAIAPAILAAVYDATGLDFDKLPLNAAIVRRRIRENYDFVMDHLQKKRTTHVHSV